MTGITRALQALTLVSAAFLLVACAGSGAEAPTDSDRQAGATLDWAECGGQLECASLRVPLDYDDPEGEILELALIRRPAADPGRRIGSLVLNPGGPGQSGIEVVRLAGLLGFDPELLARFDLVSFDPRGVGASIPVECGDDLEDLLFEVLPLHKGNVEEVEARLRAFAEACDERHGDLLPHLGTTNVARDLDRIRAALNEERLTYVGLSYGTRLGSVYAHLHPERVRAMVLDAGVRPSGSSAELAADQALAAERALQRFFADCAGRSDCPLGPDPERVWREIQARLEEGPLEGFGDPVSANHFYLGAFLFLLAGNEGWPALAKALASAREGNGWVLLTVVSAQYGGGRNAFEAGYAIQCVDFPGRITAAELLARSQDLAQDFPLLGFTAAFGCTADWPAPADPIPDIRPVGTPPIVVVGTTNDPSTPLGWSKQLAAKLGSGVLVTYEGDGHVALQRNDPCIRETVAAYLINLQVPEAGTVCPR